MDLLSDYSVRIVVAAIFHVFSVDDTENIFSWKSGGLIYPKEIGSYPFGIDGQCLKMMVNISSKDDENDN